MGVLTQFALSDPALVDPTSHPPTCRQYALSDPALVDPQPPTHSPTYLQSALSDPALIDPDLPPTQPPTRSLHLVTLHWLTPTFHPRHICEEMY